MRWREREHMRESAKGSEILFPLGRDSPGAFAHILSDEPLEDKSKCLSLSLHTLSGRRRDDRLTLVVGHRHAI